MSPAPYTFSVAMRSWSFDPVIAAVLAVLGALYLLGLGAARRRRVGRHGWPGWRTACFLLLGLGGAVLCTMSSLALYNHTHLWALGAQLTLLVSLVPVGIALGDPVGLVRAGLSEAGRRRFDRALAGPLVRVLTFPVVSAVLATTYLCLAFLSPLLGAALGHPAVMDGLYLAALGVGCLASLPLLGAELLPAWCTEPFRLVFAFVDGLVDALPGVLVLTTGRRLAGGYFAGRPDDPNWDVHFAGALMLTLSELVALPLFFIVFFRWAMHEGAFAPAYADEARSPSPRATATATTSSASAATGAPGVTGSPAPVPDREPDLQRPWWETEGLGRRNGRDGRRAMNPADGSDR